VKLSFRTGIAALFVIGIAAFCWLCSRGDSVPFLPARAGAEWIIYPGPPDGNSHPQAPLWSVFRKSVTVGSVPASAFLSIRAFRRGFVIINGVPIKELSLTGDHWKSPHNCQVAKFLKAGENQISVTVKNERGPPALWLKLNLGGSSFGTDTTWQVSRAGAAWESAAPADQTTVIRPGNYFFGRERTFDSLRRQWKFLLVVGALNFGLIGLGYKFQRPIRGNFCEFHNGNERLVKWLRSSSSGPNLVFILIVLAWAALFCNNLPKLAPLFGFDRDGHLDYVQYILEKKALPLADEGWQMYQPPLYYLLAASILGPLRLSASSDSAILILRCVSALIGLIHFRLVFSCLRLIFRRNAANRVWGCSWPGSFQRIWCSRTTSQTRLWQRCLSPRQSISACAFFIRKNLLTCLQPRLASAWD
jgi:hypothetical protein